MPQERVYPGVDLRLVSGQQLPNDRKGHEVCTQDMRCPIFTNREWVYGIVPAIYNQRRRRDLLHVALRMWASSVSSIQCSGMRRKKWPR
jgi:hypothetical protein